MEIKASDFKISCSAIGQIMTNSRGKTKAEKITECNAKIKETQEKHDAIKDGLKSKLTASAKIDSLKKELEELKKLSDKPELSETAKTYCENWVKSKLYEKKKEFSSKETEKGNSTEPDVIALIEQHYKVPFVVKNNKREFNEYLDGECDVILSDRIVDAKSAYECFTFPLFENEIPENNYHWQILGYMVLYNRNKGDVFYGLVDMPMEMIEKFLRYKFKDGFTKEQYERAAMNYIYSNTEVKYRKKIFSFERDENKIKQVYERVIQCREYIQTLLNKLDNL